jgi:hypothetical protein
MFGHSPFDYSRPQEEQGHSKILRQQINTGKLSRKNLPFRGATAVCYPIEAVHAPNLQRTLEACSPIRYALLEACQQDGTSLGSGRTYCIISIGFSNYLLSW